MRRWWLIMAMLLAVALLPARAQEEAAPAEEEFDVSEFLFGHVADAYEWHITEINEKEISIPLPCIVIENGLHIFSSRKMEENGYTLNADGKLVNAATGARPLDISITKNVVGLFFNGVLLVLLILLCARWYKHHDVLKEKPTGLAALLEPVIVMIE